MEKKILMERIYKDLAKACIEVPKFQKNLEEINKKKEELEKRIEQVKKMWDLIDDEDKGIYQDTMEIINKQLSDLEKEKNKNKNSINVYKQNLEREFNDALEHYRCKENPEKSMIGELKLYRENNKEGILKMENDLQSAIKNADIDEINRISANLKLLHKTEEIINEKLRKAIYSERQLKDSKENIEKIINEISGNIKEETNEEIVKKLISEDTLNLFEILDIKKDDISKENSEKSKEEDCEKSKEEDSEKSKEEDSEKSKEEDCEKTKKKAKQWKPGDPAPDNNKNKEGFCFNGYDSKDMSYDEYFEKKTKEREALDKDKMIFRWPEEEDKSLVISDEDKSLISKMGTLFTNIKERLKKVKEKIFKKKSKNEKEKRLKKVKEKIFKKKSKNEKEKEETTKTDTKKEETTKTDTKKEETTKTDTKKKETTKTDTKKEETTKTDTKKKADDGKRGKKKEDDNEKNIDDNNAKNIDDDFVI